MIPVTIGLVLRLETDAGVTTTGQTVLGWADASGSGNDLTAFGDPSYATVLTPSGLPAIVLDGDGDKVERTLGLAGLPTMNQSRTVFFVVDYVAPQGVTAGAVFGDDQSNQTFGLAAGPASDLMVQGFGNSNDFHSTTEGVSGGWLVQSATLSGTQLQHFLNGTLIDTDTHSFNTDLQKLVIGEEIGGLGFSAMNVAAVLVYDRALSEAERADVDAYLQTKYLTPASGNQAPIAVGDTGGTLPGGAVQIDVLGNDLDDGTLDGSMISITDQPDHGTITGIDPATGAITYVHNGGASSADSFSYTLTDAQGAVSGTAAVSIGIGYQPLNMDGFSDQLVATRADFTGGSPFFLPISMTFLPDNRMLLLSKDGEIRILDPESGTNSVYMKLNNIDAGQERGLLDITLDPDFATNGYFYLYYTPENPEHARIARFQHQENAGGLTATGSLASETVIWEDTDAYLSCCHYGGGLDFGPDGKIWLTTSDKFQATTPGEGSSGGVDLMLDLASSSGKIIRVNADGSIPDGTDGWAANPFADGPGGNDDSVWAYGLRNPFRARWDAEYGFMYIGEVGGNQQNVAHDDLHLASLDQAGAFYGWPFYEGTPNTYVNAGQSPADPLGFPQPDGDLADQATGDLYSSPIWSLDHQGVSASLTGGIVYRGNMFPSEWGGVYFYGDYTRDYLRYLVLDQTGTQVLGDFAFKPSIQLPGTTNEVVSIEVGADGALYYAMIGSGEIRRVVFEGNLAPRIDSAGITPASGELPLGVIFTATVADPDGDALTYTLNFGDGTIVADDVDPSGIISISHSYMIDGRFNVSLTVSDGLHNTLSQAFQIEAGDVNFAPVIADEGSDIAIAGAGTTEVTFSAQVIDSDGDPMNYTWHFGDGTSASGTVPPGGVVTASHIYPAEGTFDAFLEVSDGTATVFSADVPIQVGTATQVPVTGGLSLLLQSDIKIGLGTGNTVTAWLDGSGNGNNLFAQGDPQLVANQTPTGQAAIVFDGAGDLLQRINATDTIFNLASGNADRTIFVVVDYVAPEGVTSGVAYGDNALNETFGLVANKDGILTVQANGKFNDLPSDVNGVNGGFLVQSVILEAGVTRHFRDGALIDTDSHSFATDVQKLVLGAEIGGLGESQIKLGAVLIYNRALNEAERQQVEDFLQNKYIQGAPPPQPPVAADDTALTTANAAVILDVLANDSDANGDPLTITSVSAPLHGTAAIDDNGTPGNGADDRIVYTPLAGFSGSDSFTYTISDGQGGSDTATVSVTVAEQSGNPVLGGLVAAFEADQNVSLGTGATVVGWLDGSGRGNDLVAAGNPQLEAVATPSGQAAIRFDGTGDLLQRINATDTLNGLPGGNANRTLFLVVDYLDSEGVSSGLVYGDGATNEAFGLVANRDGALSVQGWGRNRDFPSAVNGVTGGFLVQSLVLNGNTTHHYLNGTQIDSDTNSFATDLKKLVLGGEIAGLGEAQMAISAAFIYDRALSDAERLQVDAYLQSKYLSGAPDNLPPVAAADGFGFTEDTPLAGNVLADNGNGADSDPDGDPLAASLVSGAANGMVVLAANGDFTYAPNPDFFSADSFTYQVSDGRGGTAQATVTLSGTAVDDPARAVDDNYAVATDGTLTVAAAGVLGNDSDPEGDAFTAELISDVAHGQLTLNADGSFTYIPATGYVGSDSFIYSVTGGDTATVSITVGGTGLPVTGGLVARYESDADVIGSPEGVVTGWLDASGLGNDLLAAGDPTLVAAATPTGMSAISFDGTGDLLQRVAATDAITGLPTGSADRTLFFVVDYVDPEGVTSGLVYGDGAQNETFGLVASTKNKLMVQGWGKTNDFAAATTATTGGFMVQSVVLAGDTTRHFKNGVLIDTDEHVFATDLQKLVIGSEIAGLGESRLDVAAALIYNYAMGDADRLQVELYLQQKYLDSAFSF